MTTRKDRDLPDLPDAPASEEELARAAELRDALGDPERAHEDADFVRSVALSHAPRDLDLAGHDEILSRALTSRPRSRGVVVRVAFGVAMGLAAAAAVVVFLGQGPDLSPPGAAPLARVRSTQPLFHEPFAREGGESARIDRIAMARAGDLRDNEFKRWGVR